MSRNIYSDLSPNIQNIVMFNSLNAKVAII